MGKKDIKSTLGAFFDESVPGNIKPIITGNTAFKIVENGKPVYIGMLLDTVKIGGINKKSQNNPQIGGMIECVKGARIDLFVTKELIDSGELLFIPTTTTFDGLSDYGLFTSCKDYEFVKLNSNLELIERTGIFGSYSDFREICSGQTSITEYIKPADVIQKGSDEDPTVNHNPIAQIVDKAKTTASAVVDKVAPVASKVVESVKEKVSESSGLKDMLPGAKKPTVTNEESSTADVSAAEATDTAASDANEETVEEDIVYTETEVESSIERIFHADNLDLPVTAEPFDQLFTLNNHLIRFDVDSRDTYVNERLNVMAIDANRDLQKLRSDNLRKLREKYFMLMSVRVLDIQKELDINNQATEYGSQKWALDNTRKDKLERVAGLIEEKRNQIESDYNKARDEYCDAEAKKARSEYNNKYQRAHNDRMSQVEGIVKAEIEADYNRDLNMLYNARRNEALSLMDLNITGVLEELAKDYNDMFEEENALYTKFADEMRAYAKELHAEDAKRLAVEEERNRISNEVNDARTEAAAKIEHIKKDYEAAQMSLQARLDATVAQAEDKNQLIKEQMDMRTSALEQDKEMLRKQLDEAIERADKAQETVKAEYEHRLAQAQDDRDSWKQTFDSYEKQHKHNNRLAAILVIAITIAALAGGFVAGGVYWNRIVAGELTSSKTPVEINVIEPQKEASDTDISFDADVTGDIDTETESEDSTVTEPEESDENESEISDTEQETAATAMTGTATYVIKGTLGLSDD